MMSQFDQNCNCETRCGAIIPALRRLRQEDGEFKANLGYIVRPCLKQQKQNNNKVLINQPINEQIKNPKEL
jgi:hypothetical protein